MPKPRVDTNMFRKVSAVEPWQPSGVICTLDCGHKVIVIDSRPEGPYASRLYCRECEIQARAAAQAKAAAP